MTAGLTTQGFRWLTVAGFVVLIPVIHAAADVTTNYFSGDQVSTGAARAALMASFVGVFVLAWMRLKATTVAIIVFLAYLLARVLFSSDISEAFDQYVKVAVSMMMFPVGYRFVSSAAALRRLHAAVMVAAAIVLLQFGFAQVFRSGSSVYVDDSFFLGGALAHSLYYLTLALLIAPLLIPDVRAKWLKVLLMILLLMAAFVLVFFLKRAAIVGLIAGGGVYLLLARRRSVAIRYGLIAAVALAITAPLYVPYLIPRVEVRFSDRQRLEQQGRYRETFDVVSDLRRKSSTAVLVGTEMFNSRGYFGVARPLHVDANILLHGSGFIGLTLYVLVFVMLIRDHRRASAAARYSAQTANLRALFWALLVFASIAALSYSLMVIGFRSVLFLYFGALVRLQESHTSAIRATLMRGMRSPSRAGEVFASGQVPVR